MFKTFLYIFRLYRENCKLRAALLAQEQADQLLIARHNDPVALLKYSQACATALRLREHALNYTEGYAK